MQTKQLTLSGTTGNLMLYASLHESIIVEGGLLSITVTEVAPGGVRLAFEADKSIRVDRRRVYEAKVRDGTYNPPVKAEQK